ncbi:amidohydrolase family protein [Natronorubrum sp. JWXQ-INN-674]|uniref:Amidohydrolase family protein n=1 Tax=Natronorubrum halalkaliphilum TaxID=2691917 RepID=A0A6B0VND1_9EURY|nr:amidohydrolase family protein [Natronorubrum halalkaliphilum]MXV62627.1 amidohydrolase family protein [Natronorubrum halalkaliphilum]
MSYCLLVQNASVPDQQGLATIAVSDGRIDSIALDSDPVPELDPNSMSSDADESTATATVIDADGGLVAAGFIDPHVHLDKAYIAPDLPPNESGTLAEAISSIHNRKADYTLEDVRDRAIRGIEAHVRNGCTRIRTHVDVDTIGGLTPLEGVLAAREACSGIADVEIVAFPQEGILQDDGTADLLERALESGADLVGGMPDNERTDADRREHVDICLDLADRYGVGVDMHVDETDDPAARSLEYLAAEVIDRGFDRPVTAGHTCALAAYDDPHAARVIDLVAEAGLTVITNPPTNLLLQGRHDGHPKRRGITRVDELVDSGVTVAAGQDCLLDGFYPYGRASMLETALLTAHAAQLTTPAERRLAWNFVTANAATVLGCDHGLEPGAPATFNVFPSEVESRHEAIRRGRSPRWVVHEGSVVAETELESTVHR